MVDIDRCSDHYAICLVVRQARLCRNIWLCLTMRLHISHELFIRVDRVASACSTCGRCEVIGTSALGVSSLVRRKFVVLCVAAVAFCRGLAQEEGAKSWQTGTDDRDAILDHGHGTSQHCLILPGVDGSDNCAIVSTYESRIPSEMKDSLLAIRTKPPRAKMKATASLCLSFI